MKTRKHFKCKCGDPTCKREIKVSPGGQMYMINHFTCGFIKRIIERETTRKSKIKEHQKQDNENRQ